MQIRDFQLADQPQYLSMSRAFYAGGAALHPVNEDNWQKTFALCLQRHPFVRGLMFFEGDMPAGYALLSFTHSNESGGLVVLIEEVYVKAAFRGKQLATQFFMWLFETYGEQATRFRLEVCPNNARARHLYERLGFTALAYEQMILDRTAIAGGTDR